MLDPRAATPTLEARVPPPAGRRLCFYQPNYFPRLHYVARALDSDVFDIADDVQFSRTHGAQVDKGGGRRGRSWSYQAHASIKTASGRMDLAVPVHDRHLPISRTEIDHTQKWAGKHLRTIEGAYGKAPGYTAVAPHIATLVGAPTPFLGDLTTRTVLWALATVVAGEPIDPARLTAGDVNRLLAGNHPFRLRRVAVGSEMRPADGGSSELAADARIIASCRGFGAAEYHCGGTAHGAYMDPEQYREAGITIVVQQWQCPPYQQRYGGEFVPNLSIIDLLMNEAPDRWARVLQNAAP